MEKVIAWTKSKWIARVAGSVGIAAACYLLLTGLFSHKAQMLLLALLISEVVWQTYFKPVYGKTEERTGVEFLAVLMLRAALLVSCVLGLTMGL